MAKTVPDKRAGSDKIPGVRPVIFLFRHDLRLSDNRALKAALATGQPVIPIYVLDDVSPGAWKRGGASRWWLHHSLVLLARSIEARGARLILRRGESADVISHLIAETGATALYFSRGYEPWSAVLEQRLKGAAEAAGASAHRYSGTLLFEPEQVRTQAGEPYRVYSPFYRAASAGAAPGQPIAAPRLMPTVPNTKSDSLADWGLVPTQPDWARGMREEWTPGEVGAHERLETFLDKAVVDYADARNRPDRPGTSKLSPHLAFGEISPHVCWHAAKSLAARNPKAEKGVSVFLKELAWREFSYHLLVHWPTLPEEPFRSEFAGFPWKSSAETLRAWQQGRTGYPIVDAGMRELWQTGWMHNRVRMIVGSFLVKDLLIPWQQGEAWFWDTLVDADLANNAASWQWIAGCGADAAPYFRVFNPVKQGTTFDPDGDYVRRYVPEIAGLPNAHIHAPFAAPAEVLAAAGVTLGKSYPRPLVDHGAARDAALAAFATLKAG
jgi:deoxyribodipyrimidine photo-lyase